MLQMTNGGHKLDIILLTPELAMELLEHNGLNRPLNEQHVARIARQIKGGHWRFNGESIKIAEPIDGREDVLDGQHRLWAVIEAKTPVETVIVHGVEREAFATIDTLRKPRSGADVLALNGATRYRGITAQSLTWLLRYQRGILETYRAPANRIENSDVEAMYAVHGGMVQAVERAVQLRRIVNSSLFSFLYYVVVNRNPDLAERMMRTMEYPSGVGIDDPFFALRSYFLSDRNNSKNPLMTIALTFKACNCAYNKQPIRYLNWRYQGERPEPFPVLKVDQKQH